MVILATNDRYWPLDAARLYWDDLRGPKYPLYLPNQGHKLTDFRRMVAAINAIHQHTARGRPLPDLKWNFDEAPGAIALTLEASPRPEVVRAWVARSGTRDFREAPWRSVRILLRNHRYRYTLDRPGTGYVALYGEAEFGDGDDQVFLSTLPAIAGAKVAAVRP
jgi:PhoPQ-activated pathogenicity-related protein